MSILYVGWSLLNITAGIGMFWLFIRLFHYFNKEQGCFPTAIFVLVVLSMCNRNGKNLEEARKMNKLTYQVALPKPDTTQHGTLRGDVDLISTSILTLNAVVYINRPPASDSATVDFHIHLTGYTGGFSWDSYSLKAYPDLTNKQVRYVAQGIFNWKLLGFTIYSQQRFFRGTMKLAEPGPFN